MDPPTSSPSLRKMYTTTPNSDSSVNAGIVNVPSGLVASDRRTIMRQQSTEDDAAANAEFMAKRWVWIPDPQRGYVAAWITQENSDAGEYDCQLEDGSTRTIAEDDVHRMNPPKFSKAEDIAELTHLNEASVIHNLRQRYEANMIYTYSGLFLVAVNPYYSLQLYTNDIIKQYQNCRREDNPPHVFAVAEQAWQSMVGDREGQSILVTGESGAGKTENTKKVIQYLTAIASESLPASGSANALHGSAAGSHSITNDSRQPASLGQLESQIIEANPILEAFGNAQTVRNNNSSRFGKFVRIEFTPSGTIAGATIDWYLLEKSRVTGRSECERNFHVFYQLLRGASPKLKDSLLLFSSSPSDYGYLASSQAKIDGVEDDREWRALEHAFDTVGVSHEERMNLYKVLAAIMLISNVEVSQDRDQQARIKDSSKLEQAAHVLGVRVGDLSRALREPRVRAGKEIIAQSRSQVQVCAEISALCRTLYEKNFGFLVERINKALDRTSVNNTFIGVLDIAGFEIFDFNSFEQLCINYTNEKLQQFFNHHMFVLEQEEYAREEIEWDPVDFGQDLQPTIDLIESVNPIGILSCLDEESIMPRATDRTLTEKMNKLAKDQEWSKYVAGRFAEGFTVQHYAGNVEYKTDGWLEKNKDPLNPDLTSVIAGSTEPYIASLFAEYSEENLNNGAVSKFQKPRVKKGAFRTVGQRHREQLGLLMKQLSSTQPHFVRCIVPNSKKRPGIIDSPLVLHQLRCNGVVEGIRIARLGYPNRHSFTEFRQRYEILTPKAVPKGYVDSRRAVSLMTEALDLHPSVFKIGLTKVFFKAGILADLEERRDGLLYATFSSIQAAARRSIARRQILKVLNRASAVRTVQRNARIYAELKDWPWWQLYNKIRPLLAATRDDQELQRKATELALAKEREERDVKEKARLEDLRRELESEKKQVEDAYESERGIATEREALLTRLKSKEEELEKAIDTLAIENENLKEQLKLSKDAEHAFITETQNLRSDLTVATENATRLDGEKEQMRNSYLSCSTRADDAETELASVTDMYVKTQAKASEYENQLKEKHEDFDRERERTNVQLEEYSKRIDREVCEKEKAFSKLHSLEESLRQLQEQLESVSKSKEEHQASMQRKDSAYEELKTQNNLLRREHESLGKELAELRTRTSTHERTIETAKTRENELIADRKKAESDMDDLRKLIAAKKSEEEEVAQVQKQQNEELAHLRTQVSSLGEQLTASKREAVENHDELTEKLKSAEKEARIATDGLENARDQLQNFISEAEVLRSEASEADNVRARVEKKLEAALEREREYEESINTMQQEKRAAEEETNQSKSRQTELEDSLVAANREKGSLEREISSVKTQLEATQQRFSKADSARRTLELEADQHRNVVNDYQAHSRELEKEIRALRRDLEKAQSLQDTTIVEHVHVLEEAKRYTDRQLEEARSTLSQRDLTIRKLEKTRSRLTGELEDLKRVTRPNFYKNGLS